MDSTCPRGAEQRSPSHVLFFNREIITNSVGNYKSPLTVTPCSTLCTYTLPHCIFERAGEEDGTMRCREARLMMICSGCSLLSPSFCHEIMGFVEFLESYDGSIGNINRAVV